MSTPFPGFEPRGVIRQALRRRLRAAPRRGDGVRRRPRRRFHPFFLVAELFPRQLALAGRTPAAFRQSFSAHPAEAVLVGISVCTFRTIQRNPPSKGADAPALAGGRGLRNPRYCLEPSSSRSGWRVEILCPERLAPPKMLLFQAPL